MFVSALERVYCDNGGVAIVRTVEKKAMEATFMTRSLANESWEECDLANINMTVRIDVHVISSVICCVSDRCCCWCVRDDHKSWWFGNM